jgi:hypothetical protein
MWQEHSLPQHTIDLIPGKLCHKNSQLQDSLCLGMAQIEDYVPNQSSSSRFDKGHSQLGVSFDSLPPPAYT